MLALPTTEGISEKDLSVAESARGENSRSVVPLKAFEI